MKKSPVRARPAAKPAAKTAAKKSVAVTKVASTSPRTTQKPKPKTADQLIASSKAVSTNAPKIAAKNPATRTVGTVKPVTAKSTGAKAKTKPKTAKATTSNKATAPKITTVQVVTAAKPGGALRATKKRAPKDLAIQYGEKVKAPRAAAAKAAPRKRRDAATRAKLQQVIAPDDGLLLRLARAGAISSSLVPEGSTNGVKPLRSVKPRRSRKWETRCGKCGVSAQYATSAALCVKCGAILVRD